MYWFGKSCHLLKSICRKWTQDGSRQDWNKLILTYELIFTENLQYSIARLKQNKRFNYLWGFFGCFVSQQSLCSPAHCHMLPVWKQTQLRPQTHSNMGKTSKWKSIAIVTPLGFTLTGATMVLFGLSINPQCERNANTLVVGFANRLCR